MLVAALRLLQATTRTFISDDLRDTIFSASNLNTGIFWLTIWILYRWLAPRTLSWQVPTGNEILALHSQLWIQERSDRIRAFSWGPRRRIKKLGLNNLQRILRLSADKRYKNLDYPSASLNFIPNIPVTRSPSALFRCGPGLPDVIFIAIDFESTYHRNVAYLQLTEVGISTLDTRDLRDRNFNPKEVITDQHYITVKECIPFQFGKTTMISQSEVVTLLKRLLYIENEPGREVRDIILVGQGFQAEIQAMKALGIDLCIAPSIVDIFVTLFLAFEALGRIPGMRLGLSDLAERLGISRGKYTFRNAGNDAGYTLRVMLLLSIYRYDAEKLERAQRSRMEMYSKIARS